MLAIGQCWAQEPDDVSDVGVDAASAIAAAPASPAGVLAISAPRTLYFSGADAWRGGAFAHAGALWSPDGLDQAGFTLKIFAGGGTYRYWAGGPGTDVTALQAAASILPGWRFKTEAFELFGYAGVDLQYHQLDPYDPGNRLRGTHAGVRAGADLWSEYVPGMMLAANVSASTIGPSYWARIASGWRLFDLAWVGPEIQTLGDPTYTQARFGLHVTSFRTGDYEWSAGVGFHTGSDGRDGVYGRIGLLTRR